MNKQTIMTDILNGKYADDIYNERELLQKYFGTCKGCGEKITTCACSNQDIKDSIKHNVYA